MWFSREFVFRSTSRRECQKTKREKNVRKWKLKGYEYNIVTETTKESEWKQNTQNKKQKGNTEKEKSV